MAISERFAAKSFVNRRTVGGALPAGGSGVCCETMSTNIFLSRPDSNADEKCGPKVLSAFS